MSQKLGSFASSSDWLKEAVAWLQTNMLLPIYNQHPVAVWHKLTTCCRDEWCHCVNKYENGAEVFNNLILRYILGCSFLTACLQIHSTGTDLVFVRREPNRLSAAVISIDASMLSGLNIETPIYKKRNHWSNLTASITAFYNVTRSLLSSHIWECAPDIPEISRFHLNGWVIRPKDLNDPDQAWRVLFKACEMCVIREITQF